MNARITLGAALGPPFGGGCKWIPGRADGDSGESEIRRQMHWLSALFSFCPWRSLLWLDRSLGLLARKERRPSTKRVESGNVSLPGDTRIRCASDGNGVTETRLVI
jgi:hypothetical protein